MQSRKVETKSARQTSDDVSTLTTGNVLKSLNEIYRAQIARRAVVDVAQSVLPLQTSGENNSSDKNFSPVGSR